MKYLHSFTTACTVLIALSSIFLSVTQAAELAPPPFSAMDKNNVNVATLQVSPSLTDVSIGGDMGLAHTISTHASSFGDDAVGGHWGPVDSFHGRIKRVNLNAQTIQVPLWTWEVFDGSETVTFWEREDGTFPAMRDERYTLRFVSGVGMIMTKPDGTEAFYPSPSLTAQGVDYASLKEIRRPNGVIIRITHEYPYMNSLVISSVNSNTGFQLKYLYEANNEGLLYDDPTLVGPPVNTGLWHRQMPKYVVAINNAVEYCDPRHPTQGGTCNLTSLTQSWPKAQYTWPGGMPRAMVLYDTVFRVKDAGGGITEYHHSPIKKDPNASITARSAHPRIVAIKRAQDAEPGIRYEYQNHIELTYLGAWYFRWVSKGDAMLAKSKIGDSEWEYTRFMEHAEYNETSVGGGRLGGGVINSSTWQKPVRIYRDGFVYEARAGYKSGIANFKRYSGGGLKTDYSFTRDNISEVKVNGVTQQQAEYPTSCHDGNRKICNQAIWIKDGEGNRTDYTYDSRHGGVLTVTGPADPRGIRPQTRYGYAQYYSYTRNSAGARVKSTEPIWLLTTTALCADSAYINGACVNDDEVVTTYEYNHDNLFMTGQTVEADDITRRTCFEYDIYGNRIGVTEPKAGLSSCSVSTIQTPGSYKTAMRYNAAGQVTGIIKPDPDGSGPLGYPAVRNTYNERGLLTATETGELTGGYWPDNRAEPIDWSSFTITGTRTYTHDNRGNQTSIRNHGGIDGDTLTQFTYNDMDLVECKARRMNPAVFNSLPASACSRGTEGTHGPDRVTKYEYLDNDLKEGLVTKERRAYGTSLAQVYVTNTYDTATLLLKGQADANGNYTELRYDTFERIKRRVYPSKTTPGQLNELDYNEYLYNNNGFVKWERKRNGSVFIYEPDALNRLKFKNAPGTANDVNYTYDLRGLAKDSLFNSSGLGITNQFDGFGNLKTSTNTMGNVSRTLSYQYDLNNNRERVTHPDGNYFAYEFDGINRVNRLSENTTTLLNVTYENDGSRKNLSRPGGATTTYTMDGLGRLKTFEQDFASTANDLTNTFEYNPANQVKKLTYSNNQYHYTGNTNRIGAYVPNGLNQYTSINGASLGYDNNGNLTSDGSTTYVYDDENRLLNTTSPTTSYTYDPLGRLFSYRANNITTQFLYDGDALVAEYNANTPYLPTYRYTHGDRVDEPWVQYEGNSISSSNRRFLHADHQGSIIALSNGTGSTANKLSYDSYGIPHNNNVGRFGYTGQIWMKEAGLFHYKARLYNPRLGRFLQTDPISYADNMNMYAYVGNDPVNNYDPSGMAACPSNDPNCIDDPASENGSEEQAPPSKEQQEVEEVVVTGYRNKKMNDGTKIRFPSSGYLEQGFKVSEDGMYPIPFSRSGTQTCDDGTSRSANAINTSDLGGASLGHTHGGGSIDQLPGPEDGVAAAATGSPAYMISRAGAFSIESTSVGFRVRQLAGKPLNARQTAAVQKTVANYNKNGGGSGAKCTFKAN